ncbi:MAG: glycosyltransferase family 4 protein [Anaerolineae bacterium]
MHILILSWEYPPHVVGGIGTHVHALVPALARQGVQVTVVTPRWSGGDPITPLSDNAIVYRVEPPVARMGNFFADVQQTNLNLEEAIHALWRMDGAADASPGFDVIHAHDWLVAFAADSLKRLHKTPMIATIHATERGRGRGYLSSEMSYAINGTEWWLAYEAWRVITVSNYMANEVRDYFQLPVDKTDVVYNGVETAPFDALDGMDLSADRLRWAQPEEQLVFFVGRMNFEKGAHVLVEAAPRVLASRPGVKFVLAGTGPMIDNLRRRVYELGITDKVQIAGFVPDDDRNRLLRMADVAVFPSLYEPFGIVALEAMAARCPVVVSDVGGLREVVRHEQTGIIVHPEDPDSLTWGILRALEDPQGAAARAARAYQIVRSDYCWDRIAERTLRVYEQVIRERRLVNW